MRTRTTHFLVGPALLALALAGQASAQDRILPPADTVPATVAESESVDANAPQAPTVELDALVQELDSVTLADRRNAAAALRKQPLIVLTSLLSRNELSLEQRTHLESCARAKFLTEPRAALGVRWNPNDRNTATILSTEAPFDCTRVLQAGDQIVRIGDVDVGTIGTLPPAILSYSPGDRVEIRFIREGKKCVGTVVMGDFRTLLRTGGTPQVDHNLEVAWLLFRARTLGEDHQREAPIAARFDEHALLAMSVSSARSRMEAMDVPFGPNGLRVNVVSRSTGQDAKSRPTSIATGGAAPIHTFAPSRFFTPLKGDVSDKVRMRVAAFEQELESIDSEIATIKTLVENARDDDDRTRHLDNLRVMSAKRNLIQQQLDGLRQQINGGQK